MRNKINRHINPFIDIFYCILEYSISSRINRSFLPVNIILCFFMEVAQITTFQVKYMENFPIIITVSFPIRNICTQNKGFKKNCYLPKKKLCDLKVEKLNENQSHMYIECIYTCVYTRLKMSTIYVLFAVYQCTGFGQKNIHMYING